MSIAFDNFIDHSTYCTIPYLYDNILYDNSRTLQLIQLH